MKILAVNFTDAAGGAAMIARDIFRGCKKAGFQSDFLVHLKTIGEENVYQIQSGGRKAGRINQFFSDPKRFINKILGIENTHYRSITNWLEQQEVNYDLLHLHNLHYDYFGLDHLPYLSKMFPSVLTLHDTWLLAGHCGYFINCDRWKTGCGKCPDINRYPPIRYDNSTYNWNKKAAIYRNSRLYLVGPSQWIVDAAEESILAPAIRLKKVIPNGIDLDIFNPGEKITARKKLQLPEEHHIVLFVANRIETSTYKDYQTFIKTFEWVRENTELGIKVIFIGLGSDNEKIHQFGNIELRFVPKITDQRKVALYYQAADVYFHPARADNFPTTILEAMACGLPVVATNVDGIPEQVRHGETGFLAGFEDEPEHGLFIRKMLENVELRKKFSDQAACIAKQKYDRNRMISQYIDFYQEVLDDWKNTKQIN